MTMSDLPITNYGLPLVAWSLVVLAVGLGQFWLVCVSAVLLLERRAWSSVYAQARSAHESKETP